MKIFENIFETNKNIFAQTKNLKIFSFQQKILIIDDINDSGETFNYIIKNFGKGDGRIKFAALIHNTPSKAQVDYHGYTIDKSKNPVWIVFPWEEWDK